MKILKDFTKLDFKWNKEKQTLLQKAEHQNNWSTLIFPNLSYNNIMFWWYYQKVPLLLWLEGKFMLVVIRCTFFLVLLLVNEEFPFYQVVHFVVVANRPFSTQLLCLSVCLLSIAATGKSKRKGEREAFKKSQTFIWHQTFYDYL